MSISVAVDVPVDKAKYHFLMVPDGGGNPVRLSSDDFEEVKKQAIHHILQAQSGWCYFIIEGVICYLAAPKQIFNLRMPDGNITELKQVAGDVFDPSGKFQTLSYINTAQN